ncbi:cytochrome P450 [Endogone sp. FLAS-F59071]|nr:cytochrome P450 [Endogone sp. FLAS-F59071]|eukprot:RUS18930.1 cytochrome P450 [Endogone sp. FLAS-F59071]
MSQQILGILLNTMENANSSNTFPIVPNIGVGQSIGYIAAAALLATAYFIYDKLTVPKKLRHLPNVPFSKIGAAMIRHDALDVTTQNLYIPKYKEHGLVVLVREGVWCVSLANPDYAKKVLQRLEVFPKKPFLMEERDSRLIVRLLGASNIVFRNGDHWRRHRKIANPVFQRSMPVKLFGTLTQKLFEMFEGEGRHIDAHLWMQRFTLDAIGLAGFGFDFNSIDAENSWASTYNQIMAGASEPLFAIFPILEKHFLWAFPKRRELHKKMDRLDSLFMEVIENKKRTIQREGAELSGDDNEKDLLTLMIEANETEKLGGLSDLELRHVQDKARQEAINILGDAPQDIIPTVEQTRDLKYMNQVIKETMRMFPPASIVALRRTTTDIDLGQYYIPKDTNVVLDIYAMHHNPNNWPDPERFDPERFVDDNEMGAKAGAGVGANYSWLAFGNGARQCIGMNFALAEQRVLLSMLVRKYELSVPADSIHRDGLKLDPNPSMVMTPLKFYIDMVPRY